MIETNLRVLKASRRTPREGDVFVMQPDDDFFLFGRVIDTDAVWALGDGVNGAILIYVFGTRSARKEVPDLAELRPANLLISPVMTNRLPWSRGYFETLAHVPLDHADLLGQHCFFDAARGRYFDNKGNELPGPVEPVGDFGLHSFRSIDGEVSGALGISPGL